MMARPACGWDSVRVTPKLSTGGGSYVDNLHKLNNIKYLGEDQVLFFFCDSSSLVRAATPAGAEGHSVMQTDSKGFTRRTLMALTAELAEYRAHGKRIEAMIEALAKEYGVKIPKVR